MNSSGRAKLILNLLNKRPAVEIISPDLDDEVVVRNVANDNPFKKKDDTSRREKNPSSSIPLKESLSGVEAIDVSKTFDVDDVFQSTDLYVSAPPSTFPVLVSPKSIQQPHSAPLPMGNDQELIGLNDLFEEEKEDEPDPTAQGQKKIEPPKSPYSEMSGIEPFSSPINNLSDASWYPDSEEKRQKKKCRRVFIRSSSSSSDSDTLESLKQRRGLLESHLGRHCLPVPSSGSGSHASQTVLNRYADSNEQPDQSLFPSDSIVPRQLEEQVPNLESAPASNNPNSLTRWKKSDPTKWKKNVNKSNKRNGLPYTNSKGVSMPAKLPKPAKCDTCKYNCMALFTEDDRKRICQNYWKIDNFSAQKQFIVHSVIAMPIKTIKVGVPEKRRRSNAYAYYFYKEEKRLRVCKDFFLKTLCISNGPVIEAMKNKNEFGIYEKSDKRGAREPVNKTDAETEQRVIDHINSFPRLESHYCRKKSQRQYLDSSLTISKMYELFKEKMGTSGEEPCSFYVYKKVFGSKFNLSFYKPKKDLCIVCTRFQSAGRPESLKAEYDAHIIRKNEAQQAKESDKQRSINDQSYLVVTADMQSTLHIPVCGVGILYYTRKLNVQNYTIHTAKIPNDAYCLTWNEVNGRRGSTEIASALNWWIGQVPSYVKEVTIYSDTCAGQNRNKFIAAFFIHLIQRPEVHLDVLEQKYLESGHTHMEVDSMHSAIEREQRHTPVYSMIDWKSIMQRARSKRHRATAPPYIVKELTYDQMIDVRALTEKFVSNTSKDKEGKKVMWLKIKCLRFEKQYPGIVKFRYTHDGPYSEFDVFQRQETAAPQTRKRRRLQVEHSLEASDTEIDKENWIAQLKVYAIPRAYSAPLPISEAKKKDLVGLCVKGIIPQELHPWFASLPTDKSTIDRLAEPDVNEDDEEDF